MKSNARPWITGPRELLDHGLEHLSKPEDTDFDRRIALISIDNAVELMIKTYLGQPKRALGIHIPRKRLEEISNSFPDLLDAIKEYGKDRLGEIDLSDIEWFHRLRNELYHAGNGLTVEKQKVLVYAKIADQLFTNLFEVKPSDQPDKGSISTFLDKWNELQSLAAKYAEKHGPKNSYGYQPQYLVLSSKYSGYEGLRVFRNNLVHSTSKQSEADLQKYLRQLNTILEDFRKEVEQDGT